MIAITGGGTGGHLSIVKALLESSYKKNIPCIYIGSENGQDKQWFLQENKFKYKYFLPSSSVMNKSLFNKLSSLNNIKNLSFKCKKILKEHDIKAVYSVGGYSASPASFASILSKIPLFIHEQNSKCGSLNFILKPFSKRFYSSFEKTFCSYPINEIFFKNSRTRNKLETIIFLGGSQGANFINNLALKLAPILKKNNINIIHQCGKKEFEICKEFYKKENIEVDLFDFSKDLHLKMQKADLAISRAGASTLFELCANNLPAIFIPYPYAFKNHQYYNAKFLANQNLAKIFTQKNDINENEFFKLIKEMKINYISRNLKNILEENGASFILEDSLKMINYPH